MLVVKCGLRADAIAAVSTAARRSQLRKIAAPARTVHPACWMAMALPDPWHELLLTMARTKLTSTGVCHTSSLACLVVSRSSEWTLRVFLNEPLHPRAICTLRVAGSMNRCACALCLPSSSHSCNPTLTPRALTRSRNRCHARWLASSSTPSVRARPVAQTHTARVRSRDFVVVLSVSTQQRSNPAQWLDGSQMPRWPSG